VQHGVVLFVVVVVVEDPAAIPVPVPLVDTAADDDDGFLIFWGFSVCV
jgi:hypothetical protein